MRTLDNQAAASPSWRARRIRDLRLLVRIGSMLFQYFVEGRRIRRAYASCERTGDTYWVDGQGPTRHRERPLGG